MSAQRQRWNWRASVRAAAAWLLNGEVERRVRLAVRALDDARDVLVAGQGAPDRDRYSADRDEVLREALEAWRANPLARRIVALTTQYVVGAGVTLTSPHAAAQAFLEQWWNHRLNRLPVRVFEWSDELARAGNLIVLVSTDAAGMSYVRGLPAGRVQEIVTRPNDIEQATAIVEKPQWSTGLQSEISHQKSAMTDGRVWPVYDPATDHPDESGAWPTVALVYAVNRPVGAAWGESDLAPLLRWLARYSHWLENRARLNHFRQSFMYVVRGVFKSAAERLARQAELNANPPTPGSILVTDANSEAWGVLHPQLDSFEAGEDGLALKKMLAAGSGNPLHFLAEPESATRTTAEAAGGPTFRHYEQRQIFFLWLLADVARVAVARRSQVDAAVPAAAPIKALGSDISARDNAVLAQAAAQTAAAFGGLRERGLIDDAELVRLVYKFAGELVDVPEVLRRAEAGRA
ncbi:MAG: hypothetical protein IT317_17185 [Anaerolineales bacterium]|nr:hypothetical protein [Anaerolineales bacterium]